MDVSRSERERRIAEPGPADDPARRVRSRVRQALVCPYCRDEVKRRGTVACGRRKCGALYHRECWEECATQYGGCAVYGCESRRSREVSVAGYVFRLLRLFVAALLFPPRLARAMRRHHDEGAVSIFRLSLARAREVRRFFKERRLWLAVLVVTGVPLAMGLLLPWLYFMDRIPLDALLPVLLVFVVAYWVVPFTAPIWLPPLVAFLATLGFYAAKVAALALRSELAGLVRADEGGGTVLGRLHGGAGKKHDDHGDAPT